MVHCDLLHSDAEFSIFGWGSKTAMDRLLRHHEEERFFSAKRIDVIVIASCWRWYGRGSEV